MQTRSLLIIKTKGGVFVDLFFDLKLVSDGDPVIPKIVLASKDLKVSSIGYQLLNHLVQLFRLLTLSATLGKDYVRSDRVSAVWWVLSLRNSNTTANKSLGYEFLIDHV